MANWLRNFDRLSFWLGFLAATLLWWLFGRLRPLLARIWRSLLEQARTSRFERSQADEIRIGNDILRKAQSWHLASPLFSLDEILIPTRLLAPVPPPYAYEPPPSEDVTDWALPYTPDCPELASFYNAPTLDVVEALQGGANLVLIGEPGAGKSVALAQIACQVIRKGSGTRDLTQRVPILIHIGDVELYPQEAKKATDILLAALASFVTSVSTRRLPNVIQALLAQKKVLLLLDGLDELAPLQLERAVHYLETLLREQPELRVVTTAHPGNLGRLPGLGFQIVTLASWSKAQRTMLIARWSDLWARYLADASQGKTSSADPLLLVGWLLSTSMQMTPLELSLKIWAAFAGNSLGPGTLAAFEAYLRRMTANQPAKNRLGMEQLAAQMTLAMEPITERKNAERWLGGSETIAIAAAPSDQVERASEDDDKARREKVRAGGALPDLLESGLASVRYGEMITLVHPALTAYLASKRLSPQHAARQLIAQPEWSGRTTTLKYISILDGQAPWIEELLMGEHEDPIQLGLVQAGRWLRDAPEGLPWIARVMGELAVCLQKEDLPMSLRARALSALAQSNDPGVPVLLRQYLDDPRPSLRQLAALGLGWLRDVKSSQSLRQLVNDLSPGVSRSAMLALVAIGSKDGLETVAYTLLHGDESQRKAAAEALANDPEEGYPTLQEGSALDDTAVRRAVVFGLGRLGLPWAVEILERLAEEDKQWVVQDAANQTLLLVHNPHPRLPRPLPPLPQTAWLIAFGGERGMGIAPGKPAYDMLRRALHEGNDDQRLAALYYLGQSADQSVILPIFQLYFASRGEIRDAAFNALWTLSACGLPLPAPVQYGFA